MAQQKSSASPLTRFNGELFKAKSRKYEEVIFFVHFYGGSKKALQRHIKWVNSIGFDAFGFDLKSGPWLTTVPVSSDLNFGWKHLYTEQIELLLNEIPQKKIIYTFSNPSAAAIEAMARRQCSDISALVCDSGPSGKFVKSVANLIQRDKKWSWPISFATASLMSFFWSPRLQEDIHEDLSQFPKDFPILSIRGWKDPLIPPDHIDAVFEPHSHLDWRKLSLPEAGHLNGLRDFPEEYTPVVEKFLKENARSLKKINSLEAHR